MDVEMQNLDYSCRNCKKYIGNGPNNWLGVSNNSIVAEDPDAFDWAQSAYKIHPKEHEGTKELSDCILQILNCVDCNKRLGLKCIRASATDKLGFVNKTIIRAPAIIAKVRGSFDEIALSIKPGTGSVPGDSQIAPAARSKHGDPPTPETVTALPEEVPLRTPFAQRMIDRATTSIQDSFGRNDWSSDLDQLRELIAKQQSTITALVKDYHELREDHEKLKREFESSKDSAFRSTAFEKSQSLLKSANAIEHQRTLLNKGVSSASATHISVTSESSSETDASLTHLTSPLRHQRRVDSARRNGGISSKPAIGTQTQAYLQTTVNEDDVEDSDYRPSRGSGAGVAGPKYNDNDSIVDSSAWDIYKSATLNARSPLTHRPISRGRGAPRGRPRTSPKHRLGMPKLDLDMSTPELGVGALEWRLMQERYGSIGLLKKRGGGSIKRRGVSSTGFNIVSPSISHITKKQKIDKVERPRDEEGYILMPNGKRDGRSLRRKTLDGTKDLSAEHNPSGSDREVSVISATGQSRSVRNGLMTPSAAAATPGSNNGSLKSTHPTEHISQSLDSITLAGTEIPATAMNERPGGLNNVIESVEDSIRIKMEHINTPPNHKKVMRDIFPYKNFN